MDSKKRWSVFLSSVIIIWSVESILGLLFGQAYKDCEICGPLSIMGGIVYAVLVAVVFTVVFAYLWDHMKKKTGLKIGLIMATVAAIPTTLSFLLLTTVSSAFAIAWFLTVFVEFGFAGWVAEFVIK